MNTDVDYDVIIVGGGPSGLAAGLYCGRAKLKTVVMERSTPGGSIANAPMVENYPGIEEPIPGAKLSASMMAQAMKFGVEFIFATATGIEIKENIKYITTAQKRISAKAVIIAVGGKPKVLGVPGESELIGDRIHSCVMCDGSKYANRSVAIIGGGDGGVSGAVYMENIADEITIIEAANKLNAPAALQEKVKSNKKTKMLCSTVVERITTEGNLINLQLSNIDSGEKSSIQVEGIFTLIGLEPQTEWLNGLVELGEIGFIKVTHMMETNIPGVFAAGDIRVGSAWQAITAAGDGVTAATSAIRFLGTFSE